MQFTLRAPNSRCLATLFEIISKINKCPVWTYRYHGCVGFAESLYILNVQITWLDGSLHWQVQCVTSAPKYTA